MRNLDKYTDLELSEAVLWYGEHRHAKFDLQPFNTRFPREMVALAKSGRTHP